MAQMQVATNDWNYSLILLSMYSKQMRSIMRRYDAAYVSLTSCCYHYFYLCTENRNEASTKPVHCVIDRRSYKLKTNHGRRLLKRTQKKLWKNCSACNTLYANSFLLGQSYAMQNSSMNAVVRVEQVLAWPFIQNSELQFYFLNHPCYRQSSSGVSAIPALTGWH